MPPFFLIKNVLLSDEHDLFYVHQYEKTRYKVQEVNLSIIVFAQLSYTCLEHTLRGLNDYLWRRGLEVLHGNNTFAHTAPWPG